MRGSDRVKGQKVDYTFRYAYDESDRLIVATYPSNEAGRDDLLHIEYYPYGELRRAELIFASGGIYSLLKDAQYDEYGNLAQVIYGNNLRDLASYDDVSNNYSLKCLRTTTLNSGGNACSVSLSDHQQLGYSRRDHTGRVLQIDDSRWSHVSSMNSSSYYEYDGMGRLVRRKRQRNSL